MFKKLILFSLVLDITSNYVYGTSREDALKSMRFPPCKACRVFVESFKRGMEKTKKGKFEGGDTAWEEEKLGSYATSEIRLVEIQESVCADVVEGTNQCYSIHELYDSEIEDWWFHKQTEEPDFYSYFCITAIKHCCPDFHYGPECTPCEGYPDNICGNNGKCKGSGTRKGNGQCACHSGYSGPFCDSCAENYYESYRDDKKLLCSRCHVSCDGNCSKAGPDGCLNCKSGWIFSDDKGCLDVNECASSGSPCTPTEFCVNNEGSFKCLVCDKSCAGCSGDGPDMCTECSSGYTLIDGMCLDSEQQRRKEYVFFTRYLTYLGLCIATCIVFNKSVYLAGIIGIAVAVYISVSEYMLNASPTPKTDELAQQILEKAL